MSHATIPIQSTSAYVPNRSTVVHGIATSPGGSTIVLEFTPEQADEYASQLHTAAANAKDARRVADAAATARLGDRFV